MAKSKKGVSSVGKMVEKVVFETLKDLQQKEKVFVHRFSDSHDAGRFISPQPADFLFATEAMGTIYLEVKSSEVLVSLAEDRTAMLRPQQVGKLSLLARARQPIYCLFYSMVQGEVEIWNLAGVLQSIAHNADLNHADLIAYGKLNDLRSIIESTFMGLDAKGKLTYR